jgi:hypothetical protein
MGIERYCAESNGIQVSDNECWLITKEVPDSHWEIRDGPYSLSAIREVPPMKSPWSSLELAMDLLRCKNPSRYDELVRLSKRNDDAK